MARAWRWGARLAVAAALCVSVGLWGEVAALAGPSGTTTTTTVGPSLGNSTVIGGGGGLGGTAFRRLGIRNVSGGIGVRVYLVSLGTPSGPAGVSPNCFPNQLLMVEVSSPTVATTMQFGAHAGQPLAPSVSIAGQEEGHPVAVVAAQVPSGTRTASVQFTGGRRDVASPLTGGWVVLAGALPATRARPVPLLNENTSAVTGAVRVTDRSGRSRSLGNVQSSSGPVSAACFPGTSSVGPAPTTTTTLPPATGPPPADPAAAQAAAEAAYRTVFTAGANSKAVAPSLQGGGSPLSPAARTELQQGYGDILGKLTVRFNDFEFVSSTEAALSFDLLLNGQPITATTTGLAVLEDGHWKVARATFCSIITRANISCA